MVMSEPTSPRALREQSECEAQYKGAWTWALWALDTAPQILLSRGLTSLCLTFLLWKMHDQRVPSPKVAINMPGMTPCETP